MIALADNISDSVGIHIYQESECLETPEIWFSTFTNFASRIVVSSSFICLVLLLPIKIAVFVSLIWGLLLLATMSYVIVKNRRLNPYVAMFEHISIALVVIVVSNFVGKIVVSKFKFLS